MAYKIVFRTSKGNTTVEVEDLARSGQVCTACTASHHAALKITAYPGVCQHCGKVHIRYLAHVKQDVADTLNRATHDDVANPLQRTEEEIVNLGVALLSKQDKKQMDVGCVCVEEYLVDCGVDAGLAARFQEHVNLVTRYLQQMAAIDAARDPERVAETVRRASIVRRLSARMRALNAVKTWQNPNFRNDPSLHSRYHALKNLAYREYDKATKRFKREAFGMDWFKVTDADSVLRFYGVKERHFNTKLHRYELGAYFTA